MRLAHRRAISWYSPPHGCPQVRRDRGRLGRVRRLGGEAAGRGGREGRAARRRPRPHRPRTTSEHVPAFALPYRNQAPERHPQDAARPEGLLRLHGVELRLVPQRRRGALHDRRGQAVLLAGPHAGGGRPHERLGPAELPLLATSTSRPRPTTASARTGRSRYDDLAPYYDIVEDYVGITGIAEGVYELPDSKFHPPMGMRCVERHVREQVKKKLGWTVTLGRAANITKPLNGRAALPLLRALRARLRDQVVLQLRVHDRGRRARRPATARSCRTRWSTRS